MVHGPCGIHNSNAPCTKDEICKYSYPKQFVNETQRIRLQFDTDHETAAQNVQDHYNELRDIIDEFEEKTLNYSIISKFNYENGNLNICEFVASKGESNFEKGRYVVNVFNEKDLVSTSEFTLK